MTKSSSGFSCHLIKTFDGCTPKQSTQALAQVFAFFKAQTNKTSNGTSRAGTTDVGLGDTFSGTKESVDTSIGVSYILVHVPVVITPVITLVMQIH